MKNWWRNLSGWVKTSFVLITFVMIYVLCMFIITYNQTTKDQIIVDAVKQEIKSGLSFREWLFDWLGPEDRYYSIPEEITLVGTINNLAYRAKFHFPRNNQSIKKYLADPTPGHKRFWLGFEHAVFRCIEDAGKRIYIVEGYPSITMRAMSIANMNDLCPLESEYGYQWASRLEIAQCSPLPENDVERRSCEDKVRNVLY